MTGYAVIAFDLCALIKIIFFYLDHFQKGDAVMKTFFKRNHYQSKMFYSESIFSTASSGLKGMTKQTRRQFIASAMASVSLFAFGRSYGSTHEYELKGDTAKDLYADNSQYGEVIMLNDTELRHLRRCVELATEALIAGDEPFGSVLVSADGTVLLEDRNRVVTSGDRTRHPELKIALWAAANMSPDERAAATVFTSGEHCPMCAAAHGWVGLGRIVYISSSKQLSAWLAELGVPASSVRPLPIREVVADLRVEGPVPGLAEQVRDLHRRFHGGRGFSESTTIK